MCILNVVFNVAAMFKRAKEFRETLRGYLRLLHTRHALLVTIDHMNKTVKSHADLLLVHVGISYYSDRDSDRIVA